jgi:excisionase family DNA binding protein
MSENSTEWIKQIESSFRRHINPEWLTVKTAKVHADAKSDRTIRNWCRNGLRHVRVNGGHIRIKRSWLDDYLRQFECSVNEVDRVVDEVLSDFDEVKKCTKKS